MGACVSSEGCAGGESACTLKEEGYMDNEGEDMKVYINAKVRRPCHSSVVSGWSEAGVCAAGRGKTRW